MGTAAAVLWATPASATTVIVDEGNGLIRATGSQLEGECGAREWDIPEGHLTFGTPGEQRVRCTALVELHLTGTPGVDRVSLLLRTMSHIPVDFPNLEFVLANTGDGNDTVTLGWHSEYQPADGVTIGLGAGNDDGRVHGTGILAGGPGDDTLAASWSDHRSLTQIVDGGTGVDPLNVYWDNYRTNRFLFAYPVTGGYEVFEPDVGSFLQAVDVESIELHTRSNMEFEVLPSRTLAFEYTDRATGLRTDIILDTRGLQPTVSANGDGTVKSISIPGFRPVRCACVAPEFYVYDGRIFEFVEAVYDRFLGREADDAGLSYWYGRLRDGLPRDQFVAAMLRLPEHATLAVQEQYRLILRREGDAGGVDHWRRYLQAGNGLDPLRSLLYGSPEYRSTQGAGTTRGFIDALYRDILDRPVDESGLAYWSDELRRGHTHSQIAARILAFDEPVGVAIRRIYQRILGRTPSAAEVNGWRSTWRNDGEFRLLTAAGGSAEYYDRVAPLDPTVAPWDPFAPAVSEGASSPPLPPAPTQRRTSAADLAVPHAG